MALRPPEPRSRRSNSGNSLAVASDERDGLLLQFGTEGMVGLKRLELLRLLTART
jgi:hypothetical protein